MKFVFDIKEEFAIKSSSIHEDIVVCGFRNGYVKVYNVETSLCVHVLQGHTGRVDQVKVHDGKVFSVCNFNDIRIWDLASGQCLQVIPIKQMGRISFSENYLITIVKDFINIFNLTIWQFYNEAGVYKVVFTKDFNEEEYGGCFCCGNKISLVKNYSIVEVYELCANKTLKLVFYVKLDEIVCDIITVDDIIIICGSCITYAFSTNRVHRPGENSAIFRYDAIRRNFDYDFSAFSIIKGQGSDKYGIHWDADATWQENNLNFSAFAINEANSPFAYKSLCADAKWTRQNFKNQTDTSVQFQRQIHFSPSDWLSEYFNNSTVCVGHLRRYYATKTLYAEVMWTSDDVRCIKLINGFLVTIAWDYEIQLRNLKTGKLIRVICKPDPKYLEMICNDTKIVIYHSDMFNSNSQCNLASVYDFNVYD